MSPGLSSGTVFSPYLGHKAFEEHHENYWDMFSEENARTQTYNILITNFFEVLYVTKFNKILCSRAILVKNEDSDSVGLAGV